MKTHLLIALAAVLLVPALLAQAPPVDPIGPRLFPLELIRANAETISLSESQQEKMRAVLEKTMGGYPELGAKVKEASETLGKMLDEKVADIPALMAQVDKLQAADRDLKRAQMQVMLELRAILNEEQRVWLTQLKEQQATQMRERGERGKAAASKLREVDAIIADALKILESGGK
ncbi:MAG: periplasmic heavy metal sensor [Chthoniobacteraceae bacterium]